MAADAFAANGSPVYHIGLDRQRAETRRRNSSARFRVLFHRDNQPVLQPLVVPFQIALPADAGFYLVSPEARADSPKLAAFRQWLVASVQNKT